MQAFFEKSLAFLWGYWGRMGVGVAVLYSSKDGAPVFMQSP